MASDEGTEGGLVHVEAVRKWRLRFPFEELSAILSDQDVRRFLNDRYGETVLPQRRELFGLDWRNSERREVVRSRGCMEVKRFSLVGAENDGDGGGFEGGRRRSAESVGLEGPRIASNELHFSDETRRNASSGTCRVEDEGHLSRGTVRLFPGGGPDTFENHCRRPRGRRAESRRIPGDVGRCEFSRGHVT